MDRNQKKTDRRKFLQSAALAGALGAATRTSASAQPSPSAPLPAVYKSGVELMAVVAGKIPTTPDQAQAPIANESAYRINIVHRGKPGPAMAHATGPAKGTEVHYIIEGDATVVTGGTLVSPASPPEGRGGAGSTIQGGVTHHVVKGDVLLVPAGTPHWYKDVGTSVTYLEVRFDVEKTT